MTQACCGGVTHWVLVADEDGVMTIAFGQGASNGRMTTQYPRYTNGELSRSFAGELGLGLDEPKSATKPTQHKPLTGIKVLQ